MRVCIYARVDGVPGMDRHPLDLQIAGLKDYAAAHGYTVSSVVSFFGPSTANGQTLQTMLTMARDDAFDAVLAFNPSRISRDADACREFLDALKACGKTVLYSNMPAADDDMSRRIYERLEALYKKESAGK